MHAFKEEGNVTTTAARKGRGSSSGGAGEARVFADDGLTPFSVKFTVRGVKTFFFNAPNVDAYVAADEKRRAGVKRLSIPNHEEKVWRSEGALCVPGSEFVKAMREMARGLPDPSKSGAKSMRAVIPTAFAAHEEFCRFVHRNGKGAELVEQWDAIDERLGRLGTKMGPIRRPILYAGWTTSVTIDCLWPEIFAPADVVILMQRAGMRGIGDGTTIGYGRFVVVNVDDPTEVAWT